ncbi:MAG: TonB-dependent receptor [Acidobacteriota bacterium]
MAHRTFRLCSRRHHTLVLLGLLMLVPAGVFAQTAEKAPAASEDQSAEKKDAKPEETRVRTDITVSAEAPPKMTQVSADVRTLPANSSVLGPSAYETRIYREPGEVLRSLTGVDFVVYGQGGVPSGPSIRGYTDRNFGQDIAGYLDGIPLNLFGFVASHGAMDTTLLPPDAIERVEVVRGPMEARFGDFDRGASINYVLRDGIANPSISLSGGSYGERRVAATYGNAEPGVRKTSFLVTADAENNDGYSKNQKVDHTRFFGKVLVPLGEESDVSVNVLRYKSNWDAPSYLDLDLIRRGVISDRDAVNTTDGGELSDTLAYAKFRLGPGGSSPLSFTAYGGKRNWLRYRSDFLISPTTTQTRQADQRTTFGYRLEKSFGLNLGGSPLLILVGTTLQRDDAGTKQDQTLRRALLKPTDNVDELLTNVGAFAQAQWAPAQWVKLLAGVRYSHVNYSLDDKYRAKGTYVDSYSAGKASPKVGVAVEPVSNLLVFANYATGLRSPTPRTEVRNSLASVGRVEIAQTESYEAGLTYRILDRVHLQTGVWRADNSNEIRGIPPGGTQFESLGRSRREGVDFEANWYAGGSTRLYAGLSFIRVRLTTPVTPAATHLPDVPDYVHQVGIETAIPRLGSLPGRFTFAGDYSFYGQRDLNTTGTLRSEKYTRATGKLIYSARQGYRLWLGAVAYPTSRYGESAFLFGTKVGVRANPRLSFDGGVSYTFN